MRLRTFYGFQLVFILPFLPRGGSLPIFKWDRGVVLFLSLSGTGLLKYMALSNEDLPQPKKGAGPIFVVNLVFAHQDLSRVKKLFFIINYKIY